MALRRNAAGFILLALVSLLHSGIGTDEERTEQEDGPAEAEQFFLRQRLPAGLRDLPGSLYLRAWQHNLGMRVYSSAIRRSFPSELESSATRAMFHADARAAGSLGAWSYLGPGNIGGRVRALVINPTRPSEMFTAGVAGGVWRTEDGGNSWTPLADLVANIAVSSLAMDPADPRIIYAGTGEGTGNIDGRQGAGIFRTTDSGDTWSPVGSTSTDPKFTFVNKIAVSTHNSGTLYAATNQGVLRSTDGGSSWTLVLIASNVLDMVVRSDSASDTLFAAGIQANGFYVFKTTDGSSWYQVLRTTGVTSLALAHSNQDVIYAMSDSNSNPDALGALYRSTSGGENGAWETRLTGKSPDSLSATILGTQGWYANTLAVDPLNPDSVWAGGLDLFRSDDGGISFGQASHWSDPSRADYVHADHHFLVFHPGYDGSSNQTLYAGNDGGVFSTSNARAGVIRSSADSASMLWRNLNNGLGITQFYQGLPFPGGTAYIGGTQDNGTVRGADATGPGQWRSANNGDGGFVAVDPKNTNTLYSEHYLLSLSKSTNGGATWQKAVNGIVETSKSVAWAMPFLLDPANSNRLWTGGAHVWRTDDGAASWTEASVPPVAGIVSALAVAPSNPDYVLIGTDAGWIQLLKNGGSSTAATNWAAQAQPRPGTYVSGLAFDPKDPSVAYATVSTLFGSHVYKTLNAGVSWATIDGSGSDGLPDTPATAIVVDPSNPMRLYVGTDSGVYVTLNGGAVWSRENTGFANVPVASLSVDVTNGNAVLFAFTHGRGAWRVPLGASGCTYALSSLSQSFGAAAVTNLSLGVTTGQGCSWQPASDQPWIVLNSGSRVSGSATVTFGILANTSQLSRTGHITVADQVYTITQATSSCAYQVSPVSHTSPATGDTTKISVTAGAGCSWQTTGSAPWLTADTRSGSGNGSFNIVAAPNTSTVSRTGSIAVAGTNVTVVQAGRASGALNDEITGAIAIPSASFLQRSDTGFATSNTSDPVHSCTNSRDSATVWYLITPDFSGPLQVNTTGTDYDTVISAYSGGSSSSEIACNDDISDYNPQSAVSFDVQAGNTYLIEVSAWGDNGKGGNLKLRFSANRQNTGATVVDGLPYTWSQDIRPARPSASDPVHSCTGGADSNSAWFSWTATFTGNLLIDTFGSSYDTVLAIYDGDPGSEIGCNDDILLNVFSAASVPVIAGHSYLIQTSAYGSDTRGGSLSLNVFGNDDAPRATPIAGLPFETAQYAAAATFSTDDPVQSCSGGTGTNSVWYSLTPASSGRLRASTLGSDYDTVLSVYSGNPDSGNEIACNDDVDNTVKQSSASFDAVAGQTYLIEVTSWDGSDADFQLHLTVTPDTVCAFHASPASADISGAGGSGVFQINTTVGCRWSVTPSDAWIGITSPASGAGPGQINYSVSPNAGSSPRSGTIHLSGGSDFAINQTTLAASLPDLVVTSTTAAATGVSGGTLSVSATIRNQGGSAAAPSRLEFYFSRGPSFDSSAVNTSWGCDMAAINAGASSTCSGNIGIPLSLAPGVWYLIANADDAKVLTEASRSNNWRAADTGSVAITAPGCSQSLSPAQLNFRAAGDTGTIAVTTSGGCSWRASSTASWITLVNATGTGPGNLNIVVASNSATAARSGVITVGTASVTITQDGRPLSAPDIVVSSLTSSSVSFPGGRLPVTLSARNQGTASAGAFRIEFLFSPTPSVTSLSVDSGWYCDVTSLAPGGSWNCSGDIGVPSSLTGGNWFLLAVADFNNVLAELDRSNNSRVSDTGPIQMLPYSCTFTFTPFAVQINAAGGSVNLTVATQSGCPWTARVSDTWVTLQGSTGTGSGRLILSASSNSSGGARSATVTIQGQTIGVRQDARPLVAPDLTVAAFSAGNAAVSGSTINVNSMTVSNLGNAAADDFFVEFWFARTASLSIDAINAGTSGAISTGWSCEIKSLAAGRSSTCSGSIGVPSIPSGTYYLFAVADRAGAITETDRLNNTLASAGGIVTISGGTPATQPAAEEIHRPATSEP